VAVRLHPPDVFAMEVRECFISSRGCWGRRSRSSCCFSFCPTT